MYEPGKMMFPSVCFTGEKLWRMPLEDSYWEQMKSPIADMKNTGTRHGGAITAALFLREYVDTDKVRCLVSAMHTFRVEAMRGVIAAAMLLSQGLHFSCAHATEECGPRC
jgi:hypothetical protein